MSSHIEQPLKVLYIAGYGRSGSTIMAEILGQTTGMVSVGEVSRMWDSALVRPNACGCRRLVPNCPFWNEVFGLAFGGMDKVEPKELDRALKKYARTRRVAFGSSQSPSKNDPMDLIHLRSNLAQLYHAIAEISGSPVIVDSSKLPAYGHLLDQIPGIDIYVVHMVRDPRAVAYSWSRKTVQQVTGIPSMRIGFVKSALLWNGLNLTTEKAFGSKLRGNRYLLLKYEDFAAQPRSTYRTILDFLGGRSANGPFISDTRVKLDTNHIVAGNNSRFENGLVDIEADREWESRMSASRKIIVSALTWPVLTRYQYPLVPSGTN